MAKKKMSREATIEALKAAVDDVRLNGHGERTVPQIAEFHGVKVGSLRTKLYDAGITRNGVNLKSQAPSGPDQRIITESPVENVPAILSESLATNELHKLSTNSVKNGGNEGVTLSPSEPGPGAELSAADAAILAIKTEVIAECKRLLRAARRNTEIKSVRDYQTIYNLAMEALGASKSSEGKGSPVFQVNILSDAGSRAPKQVQAVTIKGELITESPNESEPIGAES